MGVDILQEQNFPRLFLAGRCPPLAAVLTAVVGVLHDRGFARLQLLAVVLPSPPVGQRT